MLDGVGVDLDAPVIEETRQTAPAVERIADDIGDRCAAGNLCQGLLHYASVWANRVIALDLVDPVIDFLALATAMGVDWCRVDRARDITRSPAALETPM